MYCIHGSNKSVRYVSRAHLTRLWTGGDIMDVLSLSGILNLILMKAQQERAFLCLLLQLKGGGQRSNVLLYINPKLRRKQEEFGCESAAKTGGREWSYGNLVTRNPRRSNCALLQLPSL